MIAIALVGVCMFFQDLLATGLTIAEARAMATWAGTFDALNDVASRVGTVVTASIVSRHGWDTQADGALAVTCATSFFTTRFATGWINRFFDHRDPRSDELSELRARLEAIEAKTAG